MKESIKLRGLVAAVIVGAIGVTGAPSVASADAKSELQGVSVKVSYADLNLEKQEGAEAMYRRLRQASKEACDIRGLRNAGSARRAAEQKKCYRESLQSAVEELDNDLVTEIHNI